MEIKGIQWTSKESNEYPISHLKVIGVKGGSGGGGTARPAAQSEAGPIAGPSRAQGWAELGRGPTGPWAHKSLILALFSYCFGSAIFDFRQPRF